MSHLNFYQADEILNDDFVDLTNASAASIPPVRLSKVVTEVETKRKVATPRQPHKLFQARSEVSPQATPPEQDLDNVRHSKDDDDFIEYQRDFQRRQAERSYLKPIMATPAKSTQRNDIEVSPRQQLSHSRPTTSHYDPVPFNRNSIDPHSNNDFSVKLARSTGFEPVTGTAVAIYEHEKLKSDFAISQRENQELKSELAKLRKELSALEELRKEDLQQFKLQLSNTQRESQSQLQAIAQEAKLKAEADKKKVSEELFTVRARYDEALTEIKQLKKQNKSLEDRVTFLQHRGMSLSHEPQNIINIKTEQAMQAKTAGPSNVPSIVKPIERGSAIWPPLTTAQEQQLMSARGGSRQQSIRNVPESSQQPSPLSEPQLKTLPATVAENPQRTLHTSPAKNETTAHGFSKHLDSQTKLFTYDDVKALAEMLLGQKPVSSPPPTLRDIHYQTPHQQVSPRKEKPLISENPVGEEKSNQSAPSKALHNLKLVALLEEQLGQANQQRDEIKDKLAKYENMPRIKSVTDKARKDALGAMLVELETEISDLRKELRANSALLP